MDGLEWTGLDWIGLDWAGLDWTGLDWIGLDWMEMFLPFFGFDHGLDGGMMGMFPPVSVF